MKQLTLLSFAAQAAITEAAASMPSPAGHWFLAGEEGRCLCAERLVRRSFARVFWNHTCKDPPGSSGWFSPGVCVCQSPEGVLYLSCVCHPRLSLSFIIPPRVLILILPHYYS